METQFDPLPEADQSGPGPAANQTDAEVLYDKISELDDKVSALNEQRYAVRATVVELYKDMSKVFEFESSNCVYVCNITLTSNAKRIIQRRTTY